MIATPAQKGLVDIQFCMSLAKSLHDLCSRNIKTVINLHRSGSLIISERNAILAEFIKSDCTHLMMIDADMGWKDQDIYNLLEQNKPIIGCCYLGKGDKGYIFRPMNKECIEIEECGMVKARAIPAGFILISREAINQMIEKLPNLFYKSNDGVEEYGFFNTMVRDKEFWGEDFSFCLLAGDAGLQVWINPYITLNHDGKEGALMDEMLSVGASTLLEEKYVKI